MTDPRLIELVARHLCERSEGSAGNWRAHQDRAAGILTAINASGEWWVAPWEPSDRMIDATCWADNGERLVPLSDWITMRTAYLSDEEKT